MNKLEETLDLLGLKINQEFKIARTCSGTVVFRIKENGLVYFKNNDNQWEVSRSCDLVDLITGKAEIAEEPYMPQYNDIYYSVRIKYDCEDKKIIYDHVIKYTWTGHNMDIKNYLIGNCFKTREEAESKTEAIIAIYQQRLDDNHPFIDNTKLKGSGANEH